MSGLYVARSASGQAVHALQAQPLARPQPGQPEVDAEHIQWHAQQVFKAAA